MDSSAQTILDLVLLLVWQALTITPDRIKHPIFDVVLFAREELERYLRSMPWEFAPGLLDVLQAATSPTLDFFKTLPGAVTKTWAMYLLVMEKRGCRFRVYVGSGTNAVGGVKSRFNDYVTRNMLPRYVESSLDEGFTITHKGIICSTPIPSAALVPFIRVLFLALECAFTFAFWAIRSKSEFGYGMVSLCPWDRNTLSYDGLCSHSPLIESFASDWGLSPEELETIRAEMERRRAQAVRDHRERARAKDLDAYLSKARDQRAVFVANNPEKVKAADKRTKEKARQEERFKCDTCDHPFKSNAHLQRHLRGPQHKRKVAEANGKKRHYCAICDHPFTRAGDLSRHLTSAAHISKAAEHGSSMEIDAADNALDEIYSCDECNKFYTTPIGLQKHISEHHPTNAIAPSPPPYPAGDGSSMGLDGNNDGSLRSSSVGSPLPPATASGTQISGAYCAICNATFTTSGSLTHHLASVTHIFKVAQQNASMDSTMGLHEHFCHICDLPFDTQALLGIHLNTLTHINKASGAQVIYGPDEASSTTSNEVSYASSMAIDAVDSQVINGPDEITSTASHGVFHASSTAIGSDNPIKKEHHCAICDVSFYTLTGLARHHASDEHDSAKAALLAANGCQWLQ